MSDIIELDQVDNFMAAVSHAAALLLPMTAFLTVHWYKTPTDGDPQRRQAELLERIQKWLYRRGIPLTGGWAIEAAEVGHGGHSHIVLHIPTDLRGDFIRMLPCWIGVQAIPVSRKDAKDHVIALGQRRAWLLKPVYDSGRDLFRYMLKACPHPQAQKRYGIRYRPGGRVVGKRVGITNNLGPAARRSWQTSRQTALAAE